jgi:transcription initiation factor TFIIE subunit beta
MPSSLPGTGVPSPAPSNASNADKKRKRDFIGPPRKTAVELAREQEYRPTETLGQMQVAIERLKTEKKPQTFDELLRYLSLHRADSDAVAKLERAMKSGKHPKVDYNASTGLFKYKPILPVTNAEELKRYLQQRKTMLGVKVDDVKDGWPECVPELESMAGRGEILLTRSGGGKPKFGANPSTKEAQPRTIWSNDPTLCKFVTEDLRKQWEAIKIPLSDSTLREKLVSAGQKPTTAPVQVVQQVAQQKKKIRKGNKGKGTATNVNVPMRDYSHLRK